MSTQILHSRIPARELLEAYGYEPWADGKTITQRWQELTSPWKVEYGTEIGAMIQTMLQIHKELCPEDERWTE